MTIGIRHAVLACTLGTATIIACGSGGSDKSNTEQAVTGSDGGDGGDGATADTGTSDGGAADAAVSSPPLIPVCSDGQVAAIMHASDLAEVDVARAVLSRLTDANVTAFAQRMITDHTALDNALTAVLASAGIAPVETSLSREITASAQAEIVALSGLSGSALEQAYIDHAVLEHLTDLGVGDHLLAPSIKNAQLAAAAATARTVIAGHAQLAVQVQTSLEGACGSGGGTDGGTTDGGTTDGGTTDGGTTTDGGRDGGGTTDAGTTTDGGTTDGGTTDGGTTDGSTTDGGTTADAGTTTDAGGGTI
jgi:predicted outer membrane protein